MDSMRKVKDASLEYNKANYARRMASMAANKRSKTLKQATNIKHPKKAAESKKRTRRNRRN